MKIKPTKSGYTIGGVEYPRVTGIVGCVPKPWLGAWAAKVVAEYAVDSREAWAGKRKAEAVRLLKGAPWAARDAAADRGKAVHLAIEACLRGDPLPDELTTEDELACAIAAESFLTHVREIHGVEVIVYSERHKYAGTLDLHGRCVLGGELEGSWLLDWKTSKGIYPEHAIQLAAYQHAEMAIDAEGRITPWTRPERIGVVHITPEGWRLHEVTADTGELFGVFLALRTVYDWTRREGEMFTIHEEA